MTYYVLMCLVYVLLCILMVLIVYILSHVLCGTVANHISLWQ